MEQQISPGPGEGADEFVIRLGPYAFPLRINGQKIRRLYPGWRIHALHVSLLPMAPALLRHSSGAECYWIFDADLNYRTNRFSDLTPDEQGAMLDAVAPVFQSLVRCSLEAVQQTGTEHLQTIHNLGVDLRDEMLAAWLERFSPARCILPEDLGGVCLSFGAAAPLSPGALAPLLNSATGLEYLPQPLILSPYGQSVLRGYHVLQSRDLSLARFADPDAGAVFYAGVGRLDGAAARPVIYSPQADLIVTSLPAEWAQAIPFRLLASFLDNPDHILAAPDELTVQFGVNNEGFSIGATSRLGAAPPELPGHWLEASGLQADGPVPFSEAQLTDAFGAAFSAGNSPEGISSDRGEI